MKIKRSGSLRGKLTVPGDKSISHRAVMFGAIAEGTTTVRGFLKSADCLSTIGCFRRMGISIEESAEAGSAVLSIHGKGLRGLKKPDGALDAGNSGTTTRLLAGILAGQPFEAAIVGDASLSRRPMGRVSEPLTAMGAKLRSTEGHLPMTIQGGSLHGISHESRVASAQVKSCIALAGLYAEGITRITEPSLSRNHTELMLSAFGADISTEYGRGILERASLLREEKHYLWSAVKDQPIAEIDPVTGRNLTDPLHGRTAPSAGPRPTCVVRPGKELHALDITVPGDISSAAYFLAAAKLVAGSELFLTNVGMNPTRTGLLSVLEAMGGRYTPENLRLMGGEPVSDLRVSFAKLHGTYIGGPLIPTLIDELPVIAVMAAYAEGETIIRDAKELRVKESDRLARIVENLRALGVGVEEVPDGMAIQGNGGKPFKGAVIDPHGDHRLAMAFAVAGLASDEGITIRDEGCVAVSYPAFFADLAAVGAELSA